MKSQDPHGEQELNVFRSFSNVVDLPIIDVSIKKQDESYADIICEVEGEGLVAFELVGLIPEENRHRLGLWFSTVKAIEDKIASLGNEEKSLFHQNFNSKLIHFFYKDLISIKYRRKSIKRALDHLLTLTPHFEGLTYKRLDKHLLEISVLKIDGFDGFMIDTSAVGSVGDPTEINILNKVKKHYQDIHPVELLTYFKTEDVYPENIWTHKVRNIFRNIDNLGPFRRIWFFDETERCIKYVYPEKMNPNNGLDLTPTQ